MFALGLLMVPSAAVAAPQVVHVAAHGHDANEGTVDRPLRTIAQALSVAKAASPGAAEVVVRAGTYRENVVIDASGAPGAHLWVHAFPGENAVIDGTGLPAGKPLVEIRGSFVRFDGFEVRAGSGNCVDVTSNGSVVENATIHDCDQQGITVEGNANGSTVQNNTVYNNVRGNSSSPGSQGWGQGISFAGVSDCTCKGNKVYQNWGEGIGAQKRSSKITISNNIVYDNFAALIYIDSSDHCTVDGNLTYFTGDNAFVNVRNGQGPEGLATAIETNGGSLDGNVWTNNIDVGSINGFRWWNESSIGGLVNNVIANNTFVNEKNANIQIDSYGGNSGNTIANNIVYRSGGGAVQSGAPGGTCSNNAWFGGSAGSFGGAGDVTADPQLVNGGQTCTAGACSADAYKLKAGSPCAAAGKAVSQVTVDYFGTKRAAPYSIGAYQPGGQDSGDAGAGDDAGSDGDGGVGPDGSRGGRDGGGGGSGDGGGGGKGGGVDGGGGGSSSGDPSGPSSGASNGDAPMSGNSGGCAVGSGGGASGRAFGLAGLFALVTALAATRRRRSRR